MSTNYESIQTFNLKADADERSLSEWRELRKRLIEEEMAEVFEALDNFHPDKPDTHEHLVKELSDLLYVTYGSATKFKSPIEEAFTEVCSNNLSKVKDPIRRRADGKILKPVDYKPVDLSYLFQDSETEVDSPETA